MNKKHKYRLAAFCTSKEHCFEEEDFERILERVMQTISKNKVLNGKLTGGLIELTFVSDSEIKQLNHEYRRIDQPTDVISLSYFDRDPYPGTDLVGEVFISYDSALRQAKERGHSLEEEMEFLFVHGVLHIFGFDHQNKTEKDEMFALQDEIMGSDKWRDFVKD